MTNNICSVCNNAVEGLELVDGAYLCNNIKTCANTNVYRVLSKWDSNNGRKDILGNRIVYVLHTGEHRYEPTFVGVINCQVYETADCYTLEGARHWCELKAVKAGYVLA